MSSHQAQAENTAPTAAQCSPPSLEGLFVRFTSGTVQDPSPPHVKATLDGVPAPFCSAKDADGNTSFFWPQRLRAVVPFGVLDPKETHHPVWVEYLQPIRAVNTCEAEKVPAAGTFYLWCAYNQENILADESNTSACKVRLVAKVPHDLVNTSSSVLKDTLIAEELLRLSHLPAIECVPLIYYNRYHIRGAVRTVLCGDVVQATDTTAALLRVATKSAELSGSWVLDFIRCLQGMLVGLSRGPSRVRFAWPLVVYTRSLYSIGQGRLRYCSTVRSDVLLAEAGEKLQAAADEFWAAASTH